MDQLIEAIRAAVAPNASDETKAAGASACRTILSAFEAKAGEPLAAAPQPANPMQVVVSALRGMPPEQLLDLAIARLRAALPQGTEVQPVKPLTIPLLPVPNVGG